MALFEIKRRYIVNIAGDFFSYTLTYNYYDLKQLQQDKFKYCYAINLDHLPNCFEASSAWDVTLL